MGEAGVDADKPGVPGLNGAVGGLHVCREDLFDDCHGPPRRLDRGAGLLAGGPRFHIAEESTTLDNLPVEIVQVGCQVLHGYALAGS